MKEDIDMNKPQEKVTKKEYPEKVVQHYRQLYEKLNSIEAEDMCILVDMVYKEAYLDGFSDALFYKDI